MSAFVLPERMPVPDDGHLAMFPVDPGDEGTPRDRLLIHVIELQAEGLRLIAEANQALMQTALGGVPRTRNGREPKPAAKRKRAYQPQNRELREWGNYRAYFQRLERIVREGPPKLEPLDEVTREMLYAVGGPSPKTQSRSMAAYGLKPHQWPPSSWPAEPPLQD